MPKVNTTVKIPFSVGGHLRSSYERRHARSFSFVDLVVRVQFYAIEIARNREGFNDSIRQVYGSKNV